MTWGLRALVDARAMGIELMEQQAPSLYLIRRLGYLHYARVYVRRRDVLVAVYRRGGVRRDAVVAEAKAPTLWEGLRLGRLLLREACLREACLS